MTWTDIVICIHLVTLGIWDVLAWRLKCWPTISATLTGYAVSVPIFPFLVALLFLFLWFHLFFFGK